MWHKYQQWFLSLTDLTPQEAGILSYLMARADQNSLECFPAYSTIAHHFSISRSSCKRFISKLIDKNHIFKVNRTLSNGKITSSVYKLNIPNNHHNPLQPNEVGGVTRDPYPMGSPVTPALECGLEGGVGFTRDPYPSPLLIDLTLKKELFVFEGKSSKDVASFFLDKLCAGEMDWDEIKTYPKKIQAIFILSFVNWKRQGKRLFMPVKAHLRLIEARLKEGYSEHDLRIIVAKKASMWLSKSEMKMYFRPKTLFNATNFSNYIGEIDNELP